MGGAGRLKPETLRGTCLVVKCYPTQGNTSFSYLRKATFKAARTRILLRVLHGKKPMLSLEKNQKIGAIVYIALTLSGRKISV